MTIASYGVAMSPRILWAGLPRGNRGAAGVSGLGEDPDLAVSELERATLERRSGGRGLAGPGPVCGSGDMPVAGGRGGQGESDRGVSGQAERQRRPGGAAGLRELDPLERADVRWGAAQLRPAERRVLAWPIPIPDHALEVTRLDIQWSDRHTPADLGLVRPCLQRQRPR